MGNCRAVCNLHGQIPNRQNDLASHGHHSSCGPMGAGGGCFTVEFDSHTYIYELWWGKYGVGSLNSDNSLILAQRKIANQVSNNKY